MEKKEYNELKLEALFGAIDDLIFVNDKLGYFREYVTTNRGNLLLPENDFIDKHISEVLPEYLCRKFETCFEKLEDGGESRVLEYSLDIEGEKRWYSAKVTKIHGLSHLGYDYMTLVRDITDLKMNEDLIAHIAYYDTLTGLYNRNMLYEILDNVVRESERSGAEFAIIFMDVDNFKKINDTRGHYIGDRLLKVVAERLKGCIRTSDMIARMGGDEFTLIIREVNSHKDFLDLLERLLEVMRKPILIDEVEAYITLSLGVSFYPHDGVTREELIKNADAAMYQAKELGKNSYKLYNREIQKRLSHKYMLENRLKQAIENNELEIHYQPVVMPYEINKCKIRGLEALLRWNTKDFGMIFPSEFIPIAEETGQIIPIGLWVIEQAALFTKQISEEYKKDIVVSVNVSSIQLRVPDFCQCVEEILRSTKVNPNQLELEVTESILIEEVEEVEKVLLNLKSLGLRIALDDFGTGYSSLGYIKNLPLDTIKIDRLFIKDIKKYSVDYHILEVIVALAKKLNFSIIAEGVENKEQVDLLIDGLTNYIQGYYYYRPMQKENILRLFKECGEDSKA